MVKEFPKKNHRAEEQQPNFPFYSPFLPFYSHIPRQRITTEYKNKVPSIGSYLLLQHRMPPHRSAKRLPKMSIPGTGLCKHLSHVWGVRPLPLQRAGYTSATRCRSGFHNGVMPNLGREPRKREGRHVIYSAGNFEGWSSISFQARGGGEAPEDFTAQSSNEKSLTNPLSVVFFLSG